MTKAEREGLKLAAQLLRREIEVGNEPQDALDAGAKWIDRAVGSSPRRKLDRLEKGGTR